MLLNISHRLSPQETICMEWLTLFSKYGCHHIEYFIRQQIKATSWQKMGCLCELIDMQRNTGISNKIHARFIHNFLSFAYLIRWLWHHLFIRMAASITAFLKTFTAQYISKSCHFYIVKLGFTGVYIIFLISAQKHRLKVLVRTALPRLF